MSVQVADIVTNEGELLTVTLLPDGRALYDGACGPVIEEVQFELATRPAVHPYALRQAVARWLADAERWDSRADDLYESWSWLEGQEQLAGGGRLVGGHRGQPVERPQAPTNVGWLVE